MNIVKAQLLYENNSEMVHLLSFDRPQKSFELKIDFKTRNVFKTKGFFTSKSLKGITLFSVLGLGDFLSTSKDYLGIN